MLFLESTLLHEQLQLQVQLRGLGEQIVLLVLRIVLEKVAERQPEQRAQQIANDYIEHTFIHTTATSLGAFRREDERVAYHRVAWLRRTRGRTPVASQLHSIRSLRRPHRHTEISASNHGSTVTHCEAGRTKEFVWTNVFGKRSPDLILDKLQPHVLSVSDRATSLAPGFWIAPHPTPVDRYLGLERADETPVCDHRRRHGRQTFDRRYARAPHRVSFPLPAIHAYWSLVLTGAAYARVVL